MPETVIYAIDIGDASMRGGVYEDGHTSEVLSIPTPRAGRGQSGEERLLEAVAGMVEEIAKTSPPMQALGVSASGIMTLKPHPGARNYGPFKDQDLYVLAPNVDGLKYMPIQARLEQLGLGVPVHIENDVNAGIRSATEVDNAVCINLGGGLGAAVKRDGRIEHVKGTWSSWEIGHGMRWRLPELLTRRCHCGNIGCLEAVIGGWAMTERYRVAPEDASSDVYEQMRNDVVTYLPPAIAATVGDSGIGRVIMAGKGAVGYARNSDFLERIKIETAALLADDLQLEMSLLDLGEMAELHGVALALLDYDVLSEKQPPGSMRADI